MRCARARRVLLPRLLRRGGLRVQSEGISFHAIFGAREGGACECWLSHSSSRLSQPVACEPCRELPLLWVWPVFWLNDGCSAPIELDLACQ